MWRPSSSAVGSATGAAAEESVPGEAICKLSEFIAQEYTKKPGRNFPFFKLLTYNKDPPGKADLS